MPVMETLMLAKAGYEVGKGVFNWLDAKNKKFKMTPEERRARQSARTDSTFGMGSEAFNRGAGQIRSTAADTGQKLRSRAFAGGLENSAVTAAQTRKVGALEQTQIADLALQIADRNAQFRQQAGQRLEGINMQLGARRRQFDEARDAQMKQAALQTGGALLDFGIQAYSTSQANKLAKDVSAKSAVAGNYVQQIASAFEAGDKEAAMKLFGEMNEHDWGAFDISAFTDIIKESFVSSTKADEEGSK